MRQFLEIWKGGKSLVVDDVLSPHEHEKYITTSLNANCIEFEFQTDWTFYVDLRQTFSALKPKLNKSPGCENYKTKEAKQELEVESKMDGAEDTVDEEME